MPRDLAESQTIPDLPAAEQRTGRGPAKPRPEKTDKDTETEKLSDKRGEG